MALSVREFLGTKQITVLEHPAYSPDLGPIEFFLFPKIKEILKGRQFDDIDDIRSNTMAALKAIPQNQFQNCLEGCTRRWHRCTASLIWRRPRWYSAMRYVALLPRLVRELYCGFTYVHCLSCYSCPLLIEMRCEELDNDGKTRILHRISSDLFKIIYIYIYLLDFFYYICIINIIYVLIRVTLLLVGNTALAFSSET